MLVRDQPTTLQINVGRLCNQSCAHCHLEAGPGRQESMSTETMKQVADFARRGGFDTLDVTGGAPELHPDLEDFIEMLSPLSHKIILRTNLSALSDKADSLEKTLRENSVTIFASFPSLNEAQSESSRGKGTFQASINSLKKLNALGYGQPGSGLELTLVVNPSGAFLPPPQAGVARRYHEVLERKWGILFNNLVNFANVPLGRFRRWLMQSSNFESYMRELESAFNPSAVAGVMCRTLLSVSWDGYLYDCDFNQAAGLFMGNSKVHVSNIERLPAPGTVIAVGDHCYACTAGAGFT
jgi:radical SAM/Cys-rich protein